MGQNESHSHRSRGAGDFENYLRTGRHFRPVELKFNPYHDPYNGQFTFAPGGRAARNSAAAAGRRTAKSVGAYSPNDARNPKNYSVHTVRAGDTLDNIAKQRKGVTVAGLKWLNDLKSDAIRIGQPIKLPHQAFLDGGRDAKNRFLALDYYMRTHAGRLPANAAHPPSLAAQFADPANWHYIEKNGYRFALDPIERTRQITGTIVIGKSQGRSRAAQAGAGGADRLPGDHGGHFVAQRFNGPTEAFNHFAQDGNFNISGYKKIENLWEKNTKNSKIVYIKLTPKYQNLSRRPSSIDVFYSINGNFVDKNFINQPGVK